MERDFIATVLQSVHPASAGWKQLDDRVIDDVEIDFIFFKKGETPVAVMLMDLPYVANSDLQLAKHIQDMYTQKMNGRLVEVMLVYRKLLMRPQKVPKGVSVLSITQWTETETEKTSTWDNMLN